MSRSLVVRGGPTAPDEVREALHLGEERFAVEPLASQRGGVVINFDSGSDSDQIKARWHQVQEQLGETAVVSPVLEDSGGDPHYPTGEVTVRFAEAPDESTLTRFSDSLGLVVARRNPYVATQITFVPTSPSAAYLPDLVDTVAADSGVRAAWAATESKLRRSE